MKRDGFSLLEIVVSILILAIVIPGALALTITANKQVIMAKHELQMYSQAQRVLEKLRYYVSEASDVPAVNSSASPPEQALGLGTHSPDLIYLGTTPDVSDVGSPTWSYEVTDVTGSGCKRVTVIVTWEES